MAESTAPINITKLCPGAFLLTVANAGIAWVFNPWPDIVKNLTQQNLGFNGIVYPDLRMQSNQSCNLIEFPLLHALYIQGMVFRGEKPFLVGTSEQLKAASEAFRRGLYGFYGVDEITDCDLSPAKAKALMDEITGLASGNEIKAATDLIEYVELTALTAVEKPCLDTATDFRGLKIWKEDINVFGIAWQNQQYTIDCNLNAGEHYLPPLKIDSKYLPYNHYQIIDTGEEDGFAPGSCQHTVLQWQDKFICIDLPMNASYLLKQVSLAPNDIDAVLFTHNHDDHIGELSMLLNLDKKITVICPKDVWKSILLKATHVFGMSIEELSELFDYQAIGYGKKQEYDFYGLRIEAFPSIHSVPCAIYRFRAKLNGQWKTYSHLSDILNLHRCQTLLDQDYLSRTRVNQYQRFLLTPTTVKKVDVGTPTGGEDYSVHGSWQDFVNDTSEHIVLGHIQHNKLPAAATIKVGQPATVGCVHPLHIANKRDEINNHQQRAQRYLSNYFNSFFALPD